MNIINQLLDEQYVLDLFKKELLPLYSDFVDVKKVKIKLWKDHIWEKTYHVVFEFTTSFIDQEGKVKKLPIFCTAHSDEPRKNVYDSLKFLWDNGFSKGNLSIPHPLFYSDYFKGTFYRGVKGKNLYQFIRESNLEQIEKIIPKTAAWFAKLHKIPAEKARNFNEENSRIETVIPGIKHILESIKNNKPELLSTYEKIYKIVNEKEKKFLASTPLRWLVHGDAHPENIIKMSSKKIAIIDFTDLCLSDFARDIGSFFQQLEFMCNRKIIDKNYTLKIKKLFLENYCENTNIKIDDFLKERINNYYNWTSMRTATFFILKDNAEPERAYPLIDKVKKNLNII